MSSFFLNLARSSPYTVYMSALLSTLITSNPLGITYMGLSFLSDIINQIIKLTFQYYDADNILWARPNPPKFGCGLFPYCSSSKKITDIGMPSGHSQMISFALSFWLMYIWQSKNICKLWKIFVSIFFSIISILIMYSRFYEGCHTKLQILIGSVIGLSLGILSNFIINKYMPYLLI